VIRRQSRSMRSIAVLLTMLLVAVGLILLADNSFAQTATNTAQTNSATGVSSCSGYAGVTNRIASCVLDALDGATNLFFYQFYPYVSRAIVAVMTLGVILYGIMIGFSMVENLGRDTIMLVVKISLVAYCTTNTDVLYNTMISMMNAGGAAVIQAVPASGNADGTADFANITCMNNLRSVSADNGKPAMGAWLAIDCMLDTVIGIRVPNADGSTTETVTNQTLSTDRTGLSRGLLNFFWGGLTKSIMGTMLGVLGLMFMWSLILLSMRTLFTFLSGYMAVAFLLIISPIFIPLVLIPGQGDGAARSYFDKWTKLLIGAALQPVLMMVFVTLFIASVDLTMFSGDYSVIYRIAGDASRAQGFDINSYIDSHNAMVKRAYVPVLATTGGAWTDQVVHTASGLYAQNSTTNCAGASALSGGTDDPNCKNVQPIQIYRDSIDWQALADARSPAVVMEGGATTTGQEISREVFAATIFAAVMLFVMNKFASLVPALVAQVTGSSGLNNAMRLGGNSVGNMWTSQLGLRDKQRGGR